MNKTIQTTIGFLLLLFGALSIVLSLVGVKLTFLAWLDANPLFGFAIKLLMIIGGIVLAVLSSTNWRDIDGPA